MKNHNYEESCPVRTIVTPDESTENGNPSSGSCNESIQNSMTTSPQVSKNWWERQTITASRWAMITLLLLEVAIAIPAIVFLAPSIKGADECQPDDIDGYRNRLVAASPSTLELLQDEETAQSLAFDWMTLKSGFDLCCQNRLQRYAIAVLHFAQYKDEEEEGGEADSSLDYPKGIFHEWSPSCLSSCRFGSQPPVDDHVCNLACGNDVTALAFHGKRLTELPAEIRLLSNLRYLKFHNSSLGGTIPSELGLLQELEYLQLATETESHPDNCNGDPECMLLIDSIPRLIDSIPSEIGKLTKLQVLDLSGNTLSGTIPEELGNLSNLHTVHMERNCLSGYFPVAWARNPGLIELNPTPERHFAYGPQSNCPGLMD